MTIDRLHLSPETPEWRRSLPYLLLAIALHIAVLFYPMTIVSGMLKTTPPLSATLKMEQAAPAPVVEPAKELPSPPPVASSSRRERPVPKPRAVIAMTPEQAAPSAVFAVPTPVVAPPLAAPAAPVVTNPAPTTFSPARFDAAYLHNPRPNYPAVSRRLGEEGKVLLRVLVSPDGRAAAVNLEKSSNFERLDEAARQAVAQWRFVPAKRGDETVEATIIIPLVFRLED
ncbi:MAG: energy transducer TonB [Azonexus sp.]|nr:energy transducer TonB [Azonexus sp.]MDZ4315527.1 energy transducer TonB [Azonexus sp.]